VHGISKLLDGNTEGGLVATFFPILHQMVSEEQITALENEQV
jgi:hypothetical protein